MSKLHLYRRNGESPYWQAQAYVGGRRYRFSCRTTDKATARLYAQKRLNEIQARHNRGLIGLPEPVHVSEALDRYISTSMPTLRPSSRQRTLVIVRQARSWFADGPLKNPLLAHVQPSDILAFLEAKRAEGVCGRTVNLYRSVLHHIFRLCVRPWLLTTPIRSTGLSPYVMTHASPFCCQRRNTSVCTHLAPIIRCCICLSRSRGRRAHAAESYFSLSGGIWTLNTGSSPSRTTRSTVGRPRAGAHVGSACSRGYNKKSRGVRDLVGRMRVRELQ